MKVDQYRMERISRLLEELSYEIGVGLAKEEIEQVLRFSKIFPYHKEGDATLMEFRTRPISHNEMFARVPVGQKDECLMGDGYRV